MKVNYLIISILIITFLKFSNSINYEWIGPFDIPQFYQNYSMWNPTGVPYINDTFILENGGVPFLVDSRLINSSKILKGDFYIIGGFLNVRSIIEIRDLVILGSYGVIYSDSVLINNGDIVVFKFDTVLYPNDGVIQSNYITLTNGSTFQVWNNSAGVLGPTIDSITVLYNSKIDLYYKSFFKNLGVFKLFNGSYIINTFGGQVMTANKLELYDTSYIYLVSSEYGIMDCHLMDTSFIFVSYGSVVASIGNVILSDKSSIHLSIKSIMTVEGNMVLKDNSYLKISDVPGGDLFEDFIFIVGSLICEDQSSVYVNNSLFVVGGFEASLMNVQLTENSWFVANRKTSFSGAVFFDRSNLIANDTLIINSPIMLLIDSTFDILFDTTISFTQVYSRNSTITVKQGSFLANNGSMFFLLDSSIIVEKGDLIMDPTVELKMTNSKLKVYGNGKLITSSSIYLNETSTMENKGIINLSGSIYYNDLLSFSNSSVFISNSGMFNIEQSTFINVFFENLNGTFNVGNNSIYIENFTQNDTSSSTTLKFGSIINSLNNLNINGGSLTGSGLINTTLSQSDGQLGSSTHTNKINITNDYFQSSNKSKISIVIDSLEDYTNINVGNWVDIIGELAISINERLIEALLSSSSGFIDSSSDSSSKPQLSFTLMSFEGKSELSFKENKITFSTYNNEGEKKKINDCILTKIKSNSKTFSALFENNCNNGANGGIKLSGGAIAGIVIGGVAAVVIVITLVHFSHKIFYGLKSKDSVIKLAKIFGKNI
ncbi:hypothetical protein ACTFIZ_002443 [Dictyostelium cf. discoideum]